MSDFNIPPIDNENARAWDRECERRDEADHAPDAGQAFRPYEGRTNAELAAVAPHDCIAYDALAERHGIEVGAPGWLPIAALKIGFARPFGPHRLASPRCESGRRNYCTCDTCF